MLLKIKKSTKIYPIYYGLSSDLVFFIAIYSLFLSTVRNLSAFQISSLTTISTVVAIVMYLFSYKIIKKIGNIKAMKLANILLLMASIFLTFSSKYIFILFGEILYEVAFIFKTMDSVILMNNLRYLKEEEKYIEIKNKATTIYAFVTMIVSFISGFLFNVNPYLPMIVCIFICIINVILSNFIYEAKDVKKNNNTIENKFKPTKIILMVIIIYGLLYGSIVVGQNNAKLFIQYKLQNDFSINKIAIYISMVVCASRIVRFVSNLNFMKIYKKIQNKVILLFEILLIISFSSFIIGSLITNTIIGVLIMAFGFVIFLALRDPIENFFMTVLMNSCKLEEQEKLILYFQFSRKIITFLLSLIVTCILFKLSMIFVYIFLFIVVLIYVPIIVSMYSMLKKEV